MLLQFLAGGRYLKTLDEIDHLLNAGKFRAVKFRLNAMEPALMGNLEIVAVLGVTLGAREKLEPARSGFYEAAKVVVIQRKGEEAAEKLLRKYRCGDVNGEDAT